MLWQLVVPIILLASCASAQHHVQAPSSNVRPSNTTSHVNHTTTTSPVLPKNTQQHMDQDFDVYVLRMVWSPGYRNGALKNGTIRKPTNKYPDEWNEQLVVQGLWPSYSDSFKKAQGLESCGPDGTKDQCAGAPYVATPESNHKVVHAPNDHNGGVNGQDGFKPRANNSLHESAGKTARGVVHSHTEVSVKVFTKGENATKSASDKTPIAGGSTPHGHVKQANHSGSPLAFTKDQIVFPRFGLFPVFLDNHKFQYNKHGKCSGLTQSQYFAKAVELGTEMNARIRKLKLKDAKVIKLTDLLSATGTSGSSVHCGPHNKLKFVNFCFKHDGRGVVGKQTRCPSVFSTTCLEWGAEKKKDILVQLK